MANKTPLKANYTSGVVTSLAEFQSGDTIAATLIDPAGALTVGSETIGSLAGFLFGTAGVVSAKNGMLTGDATNGRLIKMAHLVIVPGSGSGIKCTLSSNFNGD